MSSLVDDETLRQWRYERHMRAHIAEDDHDEDIEFMQAIDPPSMDPTGHCDCVIDDIDLEKLSSGALRTIRYSGVERKPQVSVVLHGLTKSKEWMFCTIVHSEGQLNLPVYHIIGIDEAEQYGLGSMKKFKKMFRARRSGTGNGRATSRRNVQNCGNVFTHCYNVQFRRSGEWVSTLK